MNLDDIGTTLGAWALTFAIHSTILLLGAAALDRWLRDRPEIMSPVWKLAAVGGVLTASLQLSLGVEPLGGRMVVDAPAPIEEIQRSAPVVPRPLVLAAAEPAPAYELVPVELEPGDILVPTIATPDPIAAVPATMVPVSVPPPAPAPAPARTPWSLALAGVLALGALLGLATVARAWWRLRVQLRGRRAADGVLAGLLEKLLARTRSTARVRLSISPRIGVPLATGVLRREIVVPERALASLAAPAQESMLAHELAHVLRRDPAWRLALLLLERVLFFQPLLRLARRRVTQSAEYLSDAWAVHNTERPLELARCLTEIASWVQPRGQLALASGMAEPRSILGRRVLRLVEPQRAPARAGALPWLAALGLFAMVLVAPAIGFADERAHVLRGAAIAPVPMMWVVHEDGRVGGELETSPPGLPAHAAVVVASRGEDAPARGREQRRAQRKAERGAARERRATETALRRTIRSAHAQHRLPSVRELELVLEHGTPPRGRQVAALEIDDDSVMVVLDGVPLPGWVADDLDIDIEGMRFAIVAGHREQAELDAERQRIVISAKQLAALRSKQARAIGREIRRDVERDFRRDVEHARAHAERSRREAERMRDDAERFEAARERAIEDFIRAQRDAARGRGAAPGRRRAAPPGHGDIMPIMAPLAPMPPMPPSAALAPMPPMPPAPPRASAPPRPPHRVARLAPLAPVASR